MGKQTPLRPPSEVVEMVIRPWEDISAALTRDEEWVKREVRDQTDELAELLEGEDRASRLLTDVPPADYFTDEDELGQTVRRMENVNDLLVNPSKLDSMIIDDGRVSERRAKMDRELTKFDVGTVGSLLRTLVLFFAVVPIAWFAGVDLQNSPYGALVLLGSLACATVGTELWSRWLSRDRPYRKGGGGSDGRVSVGRNTKANAVALLFLAGGYVTAGPVMVSFVEELVRVAALGIVVGLVLGVLFGYLGGWVGGIGGLLLGAGIVGYLERVPSTGPWLEAFLPQFGLSHYVDVVLGLLLVGTLILTILRALFSYPSIFWQTTYPATGHPRGISPGVLTAVVLGPVVLLGWVLSGGTVAFVNGFSPLAVTVLALCGVPTVSGVLYLLR
jgi:hypothetical protein